MQLSTVFKSLVYHATSVLCVLCTCRYPMIKNDTDIGISCFAYCLPSSVSNSTHELQNDNEELYNNN